VGQRLVSQAFGGAVVRRDPVHDKTATIEHDGRTLYAGLEAQVTVGRYHSLVVDPRRLPDCLEVCSTGGGCIMGLRHRELPLEGVQFHPESVLTPEGMAMLRAFLG